MIALLNQQEIHDLRNFRAGQIGDSALEKLVLASKKIRRDILSMIDQSGSGHVGGSLSSADIYLMLWICANITRENFNDVRDRIVISHGHTSAALYSVLANLGFFDIEKVIGRFRKRSGDFEGHPNCDLPGVEWCSGSLGQGLSVGCGFAMASKLQDIKNRIFVVMSDGEQQKGQVTEAREFAAKYKLSNLTAIIDFNGFQASGAIADIMPCDIRKKYESSGWDVISIDGHNYRDIYSALKETSLHKERPVLILANTVMGKGVSLIENNYRYHGRVLTKTQYEQAIKELETADIDLLSVPVAVKQAPAPVEIQINPGNPVTYKCIESVECRTAAGTAIYDIVKINPKVPVAVLDCDLNESLKTGKILRDFPDRFIECGIQEHNAGTLAAALSKAGVLSFLPGFGVFIIDEIFGQHRMNDINNTSVKLIATHCGLDVGEDGKTHQCIDYVSLVNSLLGYELIIPADANQTDRIIRYIATKKGNFIVAAGRSAIPVIDKGNGEPYFSGDYSFTAGKADWIRKGNDATIISSGSMVWRAVKASEELLEENIHAGVLNISCPKNIDADKIAKACETGIVVTYEDHLVQSGIGSIIASYIAENELRCHFRKMGISGYGKSCTPDEQYLAQGLDPDNLKKLVRVLAKGKSE